MQRPQQCARPHDRPSITRRALQRHAQHHRPRWPDREVQADLVRAVQSGAPRALDTLLAALRPALVLYFARRLSAGSAEDLAQLALIRIARAVHRVEPERAYRYVVTVARNVLRTEYRRRAREERWYVPLERAEDVACPSPLEVDADYGELARAVQEADLATFSPALQEVLTGVLDGLTPAEIAMQYRLSPITIRTRMLRARSVLRHRLRAYLNPDDRG